MNPAVNIEPPRFGMTGVGIFGGSTVRRDIAPSRDDFAGCLDAPEYIARGSMRARQGVGGVYVSATELRPGVFA